MLSTYADASTRPTGLCRPSALLPSATCLMNGSALFGLVAAACPSPSLAPAAAACSRGAAGRSLRYLAVFGCCCRCHSLWALLGHA